jgi:formate hydrogenlyase subunit 3/multisubunit Na+/H+ antiporter MnhD subunit
MAGASGISLLSLAPVGALALFFLFDLVRVPQKLQLFLGLAAVGGGAFWYLPQTSGLVFIFGAMFAGGGALALFAFWSRRGASDGSIGLVVSLTFALVTVVAAVSALELFLAWELMTITSLLLLSRGAKAAAGAVRYLLFSLFSAYLLLSGLLLLAAQGVNWAGIGALAAGVGTAGSVAAGAGLTWAAVLITVAALVKLGNVGVHVWLPSSYAEAPDEVTPLFSAVLSKAGLFLLLAIGGVLATQLVPALAESALGGISIASLVGWIGVATALAGALMALFQEDIKYSLAYSSMGQIGYMVLAFSMLSHLGHVTGLYLAIIHLMVKLVLWIAILGVIQRTGTRLMYKMGGLIKKMPISFISVLFGIIVVSGVPPLAGFGGKWLLYTALLERGWYLHAGLAFFASAVAFLYLYRLIHSIFLGQPKDELANVKEAPFVQLLPQLLLLAALMGVSMFPDLLIKPLQAAVEPLFASTVSWDGYSVISSLGYWNGNAVMYVTMGVFLIPLAWLMLVNGRKVTSVKQFNIVYAAERPYKPETTHYAFNFFGHYQKALGGLVAPWGERIWTGVGRLTTTIGDGLRRWNTGNPQTYGFQILLFLLVILIAVAGGLS